MKQIQLILLFTIILFSFSAKAQKLTGSWEGRLGSEILQINIEQRNGALCGYTHGGDL